MKKFIFNFLLFYILFINLCKSNIKISFDCVKYCLENNTPDFQNLKGEEKKICEVECDKNCLPFCISYLKKNYNPYQKRTDLEVCQEICN